MVSMATESEGHTMWASGPGMSSLVNRKCVENVRAVRGRWEWSADDTPGRWYSLFSATQDDVVPILQRPYLSRDRLPCLPSHDHCIALALVLCLCRHSRHELQILSRQGVCVCVGGREREKWAGQRGGTEGWRNIVANLRQPWPGDVSLVSDTFVLLNCDHYTILTGHRPVLRFQ